MGLIDKLTAIAEAIRSKTGKEDKLTLDAMASEIEGITTGDDTLLQSIITNTITALSSTEITKIGSYGMAYRQSLKSVNLPNLSSLGTYAFSNCTALTQVTLNENRTSLSESAFHQCNALKNFDFSKITALGNSALYGTAFVNLIFPNLTSFGANALGGCKSLRTVDFAKKLTIPGSAFSASTNLNTVILRSTSLCPLSGTNAFQNGPISKGTGYIYVPTALIESYKVATNWITFANQFRAIEDYPEICGGATE